jgi:general secretion pathway protein E
MLTVTPTLRRLVGEDKDGALLREQAIKEGMRPLRLGGALKVAAGLSTIEEILRNTPPARPR